jgi:hypothetical protein
LERSPSTLSVTSTSALGLPAQADPAGEDVALTDRLAGKETAAPIAVALLDGARRDPHRERVAERTLAKPSASNVSKLP